MNDAVWLGLIVAAGPIVTIVVTRWASNKDKKIQYAREDVLAERTKKVELAAKIDSDAAREVAKQAAEAAQLLVEYNTKDAALRKTNTATIRSKLQELSQGQDRIHVLVNSNLQAALEAQSAALKGWLASVISSGGNETLIEELSRRVVEIDSILVDRAKATAIAESEVQKP
jgi:Na+-transporting NADH:ubiquinone oxidoreductase subunit NqrF